MTTFFVHWGYYEGLSHSVALAESVNGCKSCVISDPPIGVAAEELFAAIKRHKKDINFNLNFFSIARWFTVLSIARTFSSKRWPIFIADWDMLIFARLQESLAPFLDFDIGRTVNHPNAGDASAAYYIRSVDVLEAFCSELQWLANNDSPLLIGIQDMSAWSLVAHKRNLKVADLTEIQNGSTFDHNIHAGDGIYVMDGRAKQITWRDGVPFFKLLSGEPVRANVVHCWGSYKNREWELCNHHYNKITST